jgi:HK97 gp10 family phage protein
MKTVVSISGFRELDLALGQLPKSVAKATLVRVLKKAAEPVAEKARQMAPVRPGSGNLKRSISVSTKLKNAVGKAEFSAALRAGLGVSAARTALRNARRAATGQTFAEIFVGPSTQAPHAHFLEFGTSRHGPQPFMRPAWDAEKDNALRIIRQELGHEIIASAKRIGRSSRRTSEVKLRASYAALLAHEVVG